jgi:hypothetical protein
VRVGQESEVQKEEVRSGSGVKETQGDRGPTAQTARSPLCQAKEPEGARWFS